MGTSPVVNPGTVVLVRFSFSDLADRSVSWGAEQKPPWSPYVRLSSASYRARPRLRAYPSMQRSHAGRR